MDWSDLKAHGRRIDPRRQAVLGGLAASCLCTAIPPAAAQVIDAGDGFLSVSCALTGREHLDPAHVARLRNALAAQDPGFAERVRRLAAWTADRAVGASDLQGALDAEGSDLAALPRRIVRAWYTGVVGEDVSAEAVTFESSLMHQFVADVLAPPSHCYGPPRARGPLPAGG